MEKTLSRNMSKKLDKQSIGAKIRKSRKEVGYSQKDLAELLKVSDKTISSYEVGRATPSFPTMKKISELVHKPISYFDKDADTNQLDLEVKIKTVEKELAEIKALLKKVKAEK